MMLQASYFEKLIFLTLLRLLKKPIHTDNASSIVTYSTTKVALEFKRCFFPVTALRLQHSDFKEYDIKAYR